MPILRRTGKFLGSIDTTKLLRITQNETRYTIESGNIALEATNLGSANILYGSSSVIANSGGVIVQNGSKFWDSIVGNFSMYFALIGTSTSNLVIHEYAGN